MDSLLPTPIMEENANGPGFSVVLISVSGHTDKASGAAVMRYFHE